MSETRSESIDIPADAPAPSTASRVAPRHIVAGLAVAAALAVGLTFGIRHIRYVLAHEETDDAQVEGHVSPVLPRVPGYVTRVLVDDNQRVKAGDPIVEIDSRELDLKVAEASAALDNAVADEATSEAFLTTARAAAATGDANVETALVRQRKAASDLARDTRLFSTGAITDSQLTDTQAAADTTAAQLVSARSEAKTAQAQIAVTAARLAASKTMAAEKASDLDYARLQRSYASVTAPISGIVSRKNVEPGQLVESGQTLLSVASEADVWVVANFKETQLTHMKPGQEVEFEVDTYPGVAFHGRVDSISGATGARFALLPPDNSTGNFVKVTQRVPVKIVLAQAPDADHPLRPGMSVDAAVRTAE
jgi:membrane fusion protein (multidrug efflux system)